MPVRRHSDTQMNAANESDRIVDTQLYLQEIVSMLETGKQVMIPVSGSSMTPFLCPGRDFVLLESVKDRVVKKGDVILFLRPTGQFILHRVWSVGQETYKMVGDAQRFIEGPIGREQLKAIVIGVKRKGRWLKKWSFCNVFFRWIWIRIVPFRKQIIQIYRSLKRSNT